MMGACLPAQLRGSMWCGQGANQALYPPAPVHPHPPTHRRARPATRSWGSSPPPRPAHTSRPWRRRVGGGGVCGGVGALAGRLAGSWCSAGRLGAQLVPAGAHRPCKLAPPITPASSPLQSSQPTSPYPPTRLQVERADLSRLFPGASPLAVDLLGRMLQFDPRRRCTVEEALAHPWLSQLHEEAAEPGAPGARRAAVGRRCGSFGVRARCVDASTTLA